MSYSNSISHAGIHFKKRSSIINMKEIVITKISLKYFHYYQYLIFGFQQLAENKKIRFKIETKTFYEWFFYRFYFIFLGLSKVSSKFRDSIPNDYLMEGYFSDGKKKISFCYDIADSPHYYDIKKLRLVDLYFKAQCPKKFTEEGFELTENAILPFPAETLNYLDKIRPSMLAPGFGVNNMFSYKKMKKKYAEMFAKEQYHSRSIMCFFGNSRGPKIVKADAPDLYTNESHILGYFGNKVEHPNIKRAIAAKMISELIPDSDARIIHDGNSDTTYKPRKNPLFIPMKDFPNHISQFKYNLNISGHRMSIPYRFIHSFAVGTAILTDQLKLKWYLPFGSEVVETVEMGYKPSDKVDWESFKKQIQNLPETNPKEILKSFQEKWSPKAFANYILTTCENKCSAI